MRGSVDGASPSSRTARGTVVVACGLVTRVQVSNEMQLYPPQFFLFRGTLPSSLRNPFEDLLDLTTRLVLAAAWADPVPGPDGKR